MRRASGPGTGDRPRGDGVRSRAAGMVLLVAAVAGGAGAAAAETPRSARAESTRLLLERLDERRMPDVALWVIDRVEKDPEAPADLKAEAGYRRAVALVGVSRRESDAAKRAALFDEAQKQIDRFLEGDVTGARAVDGFTQKGNLLIERGRAKLEDARRPGADAAAVRAQAVPFFDAAIKTLEGTVKSKDDPLPEKVTTAEDAVVRELRAVTAEIESLKAGRKEAAAGGKRPGRRSGSEARRREELENQLETWQGKLVQTRLMVASSWYEKSRAFEPQSDGWKQSLEQSTERFKAIAEKYPTLGGGFFARYYRGRNLAALGKYDDAVETLAQLVALQGQSPLASLLRRKALATTVECWLGAKKFGEFTPDQRKMVLATVPPAQLDEDWLALKLRVAQLLEAQAAAAGEKAKARPMLQDAKKLALEVNRANREFASEARELLGRIGADVPDGPSNRTFAAAMDEARQAVTVMQQAAAEGKAATDAAAKTAAVERGAAARAQATAAVRDALRRPGDAELDAVNQARYLLTFLFYDAGRYHDAATLGRFLAERYPSAKGSRQAATIAMASWQQLQKKQPDPGWREDAKAKGADMAERIMRIWSGDTEAGDAALVALQSVINARDPQALVEFVAKTPASSPRRPDVLLGAGAALWRETLEQRRREGVDPAQADALKRQAVAWLDEGLAAAGSLKPSATTAGGALARCQIAREDGDTKLAIRWLEDPRHGPWTVALDPQADAALREGPFAEAALGVALRCFVEAEVLDKAQQAMTRLEQLAGQGPESAARLTAMYFTMGQELQGELEALARDSGGDRARARARARSILAGFEKFLDGVAKRDSRVASQIWVASTYLTLGSGAGTGAIVPAAEAAKYLDRSSAVFEKLLARTGEADVAKFEPALRLKMAEIHGARGRWAEAEEQVNWLLSDKRRQNTPDLQMQAARILQSAGERLATSDPAAAEEKLRQAGAGRTSGESVVWGWGGIANRLARQVTGSDDARSRKARDQFFEARLNLATCLLRRAMLPGKSPAEKQEHLTKAADSIDVTRRLYPDLGGQAFTERFDRLLKEIQKERG
jgi:hypothetical protein